MSPFLFFPPLFFFPFSFYRQFKRFDGVTVEGVVQESTPPLCMFRLPPLFLFFSFFLPSCMLGRDHNGRMRGGSFFSLFLSFFPWQPLALAMVYSGKEGDRDTGPFSSLLFFSPP